MDPVHEHDDKWYFWDETWSQRVGPYDTKAKAAEALVRYCETELGFDDQ